MQASSALAIACSCLTLRSTARCPRGHSESAALTAKLRALTQLTSYSQCLGTRFPLVPQKKTAPSLKSRRASLHQFLNKRPGHLRRHARVLMN